MCVAMLIGFRPSQLPAAAPLCRGFRAAVRVPVPPSAVRPRAGGAPRPRLGLQKAVEDLVLCDLGSVAGSMPWTHTLGFYEQENNVSLQNSIKEIEKHVVKQLF